MKTPFTRRSITSEPTIYHSYFRMEWIFHTSVRDSEGRLIMLGLNFYRRRS